MLTFIGNETDDANNPWVGEAGGNDVDNGRGESLSDEDPPIQQDASEETSTVLNKDEEEEDKSTSDFECLLMCLFVIVI